MAETMHIVLSSNERYMPGATVALASVAVSARAETLLHFHVFTEGVKDETFAFLVSVVVRNHPKSEVSRHDMTDAQLAGLPYWAGSRMAAARCLYAEILSDVDWCLYVDCDILYLASIEEHFSYRDDSKLALVSREQSKETCVHETKWIQDTHGVKIDEQEYFNSGVMLFNFKRMREEGISKKLMEFFKQHAEIPSPDQDALNAIMAGRVMILPDKWNRLQIFLNDPELLERPVIHYVSGIPWLPRLGVVANGRFRLWHAFADKFVWQEKEASYRCLFTKRHLLLKKVCFYILRMPLLGNLFAFSLQTLGRVNTASGWRWAQTANDCSNRVIKRVLDDMKCECVQ